MWNILYGVTTTLLSTIIIFLMKELIKYRESEKKENKADEDLLLGMSRLFLMDRIDKSLQRGYTTIDEYDVINKLYTAYRIKGGNGTIKHLYEDKYETLKVLEKKL